MKSSFARQETFKYNNKDEDKHEEIFAEIRIKGEDLDHEIKDGKLNVDLDLSKFES